MNIPLDLLVDKETNVYELTCVAIKRAERITRTGDEEIELYNGKIVSTSIAQVLEERVEYETQQPE